MPNSWKFPLRPQGTDPPTNRPPQGVTGGSGTGLDSITTDQQRGQVRTIKTKLFMAPNFCSCHDHHHHRHYTASSLLLFSHIWIKCSVVSNQLFMCVWEHTFPIVVAGAQNSPSERPTEPGSQADPSTYPGYCFRTVQL